MPKTWNGGRRLTWEEAEIIREMWDEGVLRREIARMMGVSQETIRWVVRGVRYSNRVGDGSCRRKQLPHGPVPVSAEYLKANEYTGRIVTDATAHIARLAALEARDALRDAADAMCGLDRVAA